MAIYYVYSGAAGANNGTSWTNAYTALQTALSGKAAGDVFYVAHDHAQTSGSGNVTFASNGSASNPCKVICVNRAGSVPPVSADRRTTAQCTTTGNNWVIINNNTHYDGIIFSGATGISGSTTVAFAQAGANDALRFDNCQFIVGHTAASGGIVFGISSQGGSLVEFNNTTVAFGNVSQTITNFAALKWRNTPSAIAGGTVPTTLFTPTAATGGSVDCVGVDFSAAGSGKTIVGSAAGQARTFMFTDCKLGASVTKSAVPTGRGMDIDFIRSASSGVNYTVFSQRLTGTLDEETTIVRTGGASDGTTAIAWKIVTTASATFSFPFECPPIATWNDTTGSSVTATVEGIWGGGAVPLDTEIWLECEYLGSSSSPLGSFVADCAADLLTTGANQTSSSETWGGSTTKFKLACTFTPQMKGWIYARVRVGKASSTFYIDPLVTLS